VAVGNFAGSPSEILVSECSIVTRLEDCVSRQGSKGGVCARQSRDRRAVERELTCGGG